MAVAKPAKKKEKEPEGPEHKSGMMEDGGKDPSQSETLDDGAFVPGKGKERARAEAQGEELPSEKTADEDKPKKAPPNRKTIGVFGEALIGFGKAPIPGPGTLLTPNATSFGFLIGGHYDLSPAFRLMLRVPWSTGSFDEDGGSRSTNALGNPELLARLRLTDAGETEWAVRLGIGVPVAQGTADPTEVKDPGAAEQGGMQRLADAANGWHDPELYAPKRLPISPALQLVHRMDKLRLNAELKAVIMPKIGGSIASPNGGSTVSGTGTYKMNGLAATALIGGTASYEVISHGFLALSAWATYAVMEPVYFDSRATTPTPFQFALEPKLIAQFGKVVPSAGFVLPLGGQLGGNIMGLRLHVDVLF